MTQFRYKAFTSAGELRDGVKEGASKAAILNDLRQQGWWPVTAEEVRSRSQSFFTFPSRNAFSAKEMASFFFKIATLLKSGITLEQALVMLSKRSGAKELTKAIGEVLARVRDGSSLAQALAINSAFPKVALGMVRAGESGGNLEEALLRLAEMMKRSAAIRGEILSALVYPVILLITACLTICMVMVVVVPAFKPLFDDAGRPPPFAFQVLMEISQFATSWGWLVLILSAAGWLGFRQLRQNLQFQTTWDQFKLRIPLIGKLLTEIEIERFCRTLGTLCMNEVALPTALTLSSESINNTAMAKAVAEVTKGLREGGRLAERLAHTGQFPAETLDLLQVGETSGHLSEMLLQQADISKQKSHETISRLLALLVPAITLFLGVVVAGIVTTLLVAILSVNNLALQ